MTSTADNLRLIASLLDATGLDPASFGLGCDPGNHLRIQVHTAQAFDTLSAYLTDTPPSIDTDTAHPGLTFYTSTGEWAGSRITLVRCDRFAQVPA